MPASSCQSVNQCQYTLNPKKLCFSTCPGCQLPLSIDDHECVQALGGKWHSSCFICYDCNSFLSSWYALKNGKLYCREHYWNLVGESCNHCGLYISGPIMLAGQHRYHPECFACFSCRFIIGYGEPYCFVERSKLFCDNCHQKSLSLDHAGNVLNAQNALHSIQVIELPAESVSDFLGIVMSNGCQLSIETSARPASDIPCINVDKVDKGSCDLKTGDKILEINGHPVKELEHRSLNEINSLIKELKSVSLTIERDLPVHDADKNVALKSRSIGSAEPAPSSPTSTDETDDVGLLGQVKLRKTDCGIRRRLTLPKGFIADVHPKHRSEWSPNVMEKHADINRSSSLKQLPSGQRVFRPSDLEYGETLGSGFFGVAKKVTDKKTGELMVIKELLQFSKEAQESFLKEVWVLRGLCHPNVLRFIGVLYKEKRLNIVTEFAPGGTLQTRITKFAVPWLQRIRFAQDIASGMAYLHSKDIVHRDLNSGNCFLKKDDTVVVADFGLARSFASREATSPSTSYPADDPGNAQRRRLIFRRLRCKTVVGNPFFMAPEMMNGRTYDEKVDVFSFGIIICEIIGGVEADPDYVPRTNDFGLDFDAFSTKYGHDCPEPFLKLPIVCCNMNSTLRPTFQDLDRTLTRFLDEMEERNFRTVEKFH